VIPKAHLIAEMVVGIWRSGLNGEALNLAQNREKILDGL
jgi:hypothetical protein